MSVDILPYEGKFSKSPFSFVFLFQTSLALNLGLRHTYETPILKAFRQPERNDPRQVEIAGYLVPQDENHVYEEVGC